MSSNNSERDRVFWLGDYGVMTWRGDGVLAIQEKLNNSLKVGYYIIFFIKQHLAYTLKCTCNSFAL